MIESCTSFAGHHRIACGSFEFVAVETKRRIDSGETSQILIFDDKTSDQLEFDFRGTLEDVRRRLQQWHHESETKVSGASQTRQSEKPGPCLGEQSTSSDEIAQSTGRPGRPKLGVISREVTLLPRHWEWLNSQPGGASVAIRKLVETARRDNTEKDFRRQWQESAYSFMSAMAGNNVGFEEATRALFAGDEKRFDSLIKEWPIDVRQHVHKLASRVFVQKSGA